MTEAEILAILQVAFSQCEAAGFPLDAQQKQILLQVLIQELLSRSATQSNSSSESNTSNPLDELSDQERHALLQFVKEQERKKQPWKVQLLNDWLQSKNSGSVQFIRDRYGIQWLDSIKPVHLAKYDELDGVDGLRLKVGDRIEVSNGLWEWIQQGDPASQEWFSCLVIGIFEIGDGDRDHTSCVIRFENGSEYEVQGIYEWNRHNWRWTKE